MNRKEIERMMRYSPSRRTYSIDWGFVAGEVAAVLAFAMFFAILALV